VEILRGGLIFVVAVLVQFNDIATLLYKRDTRSIGERAGVTGVGTEFGPLLTVAIDHVNRSRRDLPQYEPRILFFTDGGADISSSQLGQLEVMSVRMDVVGYGSVSQQTLDQLATGGGQLTISCTQPLSRKSAGAKNSSHVRKMN
jgi:hypothetical protein